MRAARLGGGIADQYLYSATNLIPSIAVARSSDVTDFALFSSIFLVYALLTAASRAVIAEPAAIRSVGENLSEKIEGASRVLVWRCVLISAPAWLMLLGIAMVAESSAVSRSPVTWCILVALGFPFHVLHDLARTVQIAGRRPTRPLFSDATWFCLAAVGLFPAEVDAVAWASLTWVLGGIAASLIVCPPRPARGQALRLLWSGLLWSDDYSRPYLVEYLMQPAVVQVSQLLCGVVGSPDSLAALRGGTVIFRPLQLLLTAHRTLAFGESNTRGRRFSSVLFAGMLASTLGTTVYTVLLLLLPDRYGRALLGPTWSLVHAVLIPLAIGQVFALVSYVYVTDLKARRAVMGLGSIRVVGLIAIPLLTALGAALSGPAAAAWGLCAGQGLGAAWVVRRAVVLRRGLNRL